MMEGGFLASPIGQPYSSANRFDAGVHVRWSLNEALYAKQRRQQADSNIQQVRLTYDDLAKLTLGVQEACDAIQSGYDQVALAEKHIRYAEESHRLSAQRLAKASSRGVPAKFCWRCVRSAAPG